ncbi:unnamed protein product [Phaeothamnion confervicola]
MHLLQEKWLSFVIILHAALPIMVGLAAQSPLAAMRDLIEASVLAGLRDQITEHSGKMEALARRGGRPRPFVTLTYAQSIDGSIALADKARLNLSGPETLAMTHALRCLHDTILVGAGTIKVDDPKLTVRHWSGDDSSDGGQGWSTGDSAAARRRQCPRPVILHTAMSVPLTTNVQDAIVFTSFASPSTQRWLSGRAESAMAGGSGGGSGVRRGRGGNAGGDGRKDRENDDGGGGSSGGGGGPDHIIVQCGTAADGRCDVGDCLEKLYSMGYRAVMVEGGAQIISSFLRLGGCVDKMIVTVAPVVVGGYPAVERDSPLGPTAVRFDRVRYVQLGRDLVVIGDLSSAAAVALPEAAAGVGSVVAGGTAAAPAPT